MELEITPEPSEDEREAIVTALAEGEGATAGGPWRDDDEEP